MQSAISRRQEILDVLMRRRQDTISNLAFEFHVSKRTIKRDICILSRNHSIETKQGHGGGIRVADGYYIDRNYLSNEQEKMLRNLIISLSPEEQKTMREILIKFRLQCDGNGCRLLCHSGSGTASGVQKHSVHHCQLRPLCQRRSQRRHG